MPAPLTDRERAVLEAVIETYVQTAEPAVSRTIAKRHQQLGLSPATSRHQISDRGGVTDRRWRPPGRGGSRTIAKRHQQLGLSPATIRNTMSDLEEKGYLYHP